MTRGVPGAADGFDNTTLRGRVYQHLREGILTNRIAPGTVLQEVPLAESLGVSRGPIREALGDLAAEGLVTITPRRGAVVTSLSKRDFLEAYQVREALESLAVQLAVPVMTERALHPPRARPGADEGSRRAGRLPGLLRCQHRVPRCLGGRRRQRQAARRVSAAHRPDGPLPPTVGPAARRPRSIDRGASATSSTLPAPGTPSWRAP